MIKTFQKNISEQRYWIDLYSAIFWANKNIVLCNEVYKLGMPYPDGEGNRPAQWYITEWSDADVKNLKEWFPGLDIRFCKQIGLYVLGVHEWGTPWRDCRTPCKLEWLHGCHNWDRFGHMSYTVDINLAGNILHKTVHFYMSDKVYHEEG